MHKAPCNSFPTAHTAARRRSGEPVGRCGMKALRLSLPWLATAAALAISLVQAPKGADRAPDLGPSAVEAVEATPPAPAMVVHQTGRASWYGPGFHGRKTANGEIFDMHALTAAHRTLPIPSIVRVTSRDTGRSVEVRVNDRGPYHGRRVIDLSYAAAEELGLAQRGTGIVDLVVLHHGPPKAAAQKRAAGKLDPVKAGQRQAAKTSTVPKARLTSSKLASPKDGRRPAATKPIRTAARNDARPTMRP